MNKNGFTFVELMVSVFIIIIITMSSYMLYETTIKNSIFQNKKEDAILQTGTFMLDITNAINSSKNVTVEDNKLTTSDYIYNIIGSTIYKNNNPILTADNIVFSENAGLITIEISKGGVVLSTKIKAK